ncbi:glycerol-3-phosphate cytidylyltransferase [sediment metagenome]|uniref:Glycerol-3-phosphate cytidylyltransferase n=1 Tax=sediment metagenome TaxID=749907 RepID=D9PFE4_9ZZZZ
MTNKKQIVVAVSGYFDPLHVGHLQMFIEAKKLGDKLVVIINNDEQMKIKGKPRLMRVDDRAEIIRHLKMVDGVFISIDKDRSVCESLKIVKPNIFANGGDRNEDNIPEAEVCRQFNIKMIDNCGEKIRSSSELIKNCGKE